MTSFFSVKGGPIWIKFHRLVQNDMSTAVIWSNSKSDVEFQYGGRLGEFHGMSSQSHLPHCGVLPPANSTACHPRAICHIAGCRHLSWSQSYMSHCRVLPPSECNGMSSQSHVSHCRVLPLDEFTVMIRNLRSFEIRFESYVLIRFESDEPIWKFRIAAPATFAIVP